MKKRPRHKYTAEDSCKEKTRGKAKPRRLDPNEFDPPEPDGWEDDEE